MSAEIEVTLKLKLKSAPGMAKRAMHMTLDGGAATIEADGEEIGDIAPVFGGGMVIRRAVDYGPPGDDYEKWFLSLVDLWEAFEEARGDLVPLHEME